MSQCSVCLCDLPDSETLCSECYEARYAELGRPKSLLESVRQFGRNPRRARVIEDRFKAQPWWFAWAFGVAGLALDWRCAFEWFAGKSPLYSELVVGRAVLIVLACAGVALLAVCVTREARWRHASPLFFLASAVVYDILSVHWIATRR